MELRAFAEQVLFAATLEEKLRGPGEITDAHPGPALLGPEVPGRPRELRFKSSSTGQKEFPGLHRLEQEAERGRLLHFFANHELLATELMALVLLKFPAAPAAFRRGVLQTLKDEQEHTRLYLRRMEECGVRFGELPVSGYFWRAVAPMETPMDFVAGLSLTFEQANLDFAQHFSRSFATVGDAASALLLEKIYRDEIAHVAHGLKWFRRWKNPNQSDWEAFCRQLKFPLSPQRAKGRTLNVAGRRAAGLDDAFIAELDVYAQSKGRTPSVFVFNPFAEGYIAQGASFTPVKHQVQLAHDLANLPQFLGRQDDLVLVPERPGVEFLSGLKQAGFALPEFAKLERSAEDCSAWGRAWPVRAEQCSALRALGELARDQESDLAQRKLGRLRPWAWAPDSVALLAPLFANVTGDARAADRCFNERIASLYSKSWSAALLRRFLSQRPKEFWLCDENEVGVTAHTLADALAAIAAIRTRGHHKVVVKESLGLAGQNAIRLWEPDLADAQHRWLATAAENRRPLVVEPWLERLKDFSVQLEMTREGLKLIGYTGLINDHRGQFQANWAAPNHARRIPAAVTALFPEPADISNQLQRLYADLFALLESELRAVAYLGPLGIDAFVYRAASGQVRLKPVVEINPRYTMGRLTLELMKHAAPGRYGLFRLLTRGLARTEGGEDFPSFARLLRERFPLELEGEPVHKISSGAICLNDPAQAQVCLATFQVSHGMP